MLSALWTRYSGRPPESAWTEIDGNVITCTLVDAAGPHDRPARGAPVAAGRLSMESYERAAVDAVVRLTRQRVASHATDRERGDRVATEIFTLEASLERGSPRAGHRP